jgi:hypothetical protein
MLLGTKLGGSGLEGRLHDLNKYYIILSKSRAKEAEKL